MYSLPDREEQVLDSHLLHACRLCFASLLLVSGVRALSAHHDLLVSGKLAPSGHVMAHTASGGKNHLAPRRFPCIAQAPGKASSPELTAPLPSLPLPSAGLAFYATSAAIPRSSHDGVYPGRTHIPAVAARPSSGSKTNVG